MHRKIGAAVVVLVLFASPNIVSFAQSPNGTRTGTNPTQEGIGNTSSTHNPRPQSSVRLCHVFLRAAVRNRKYFKTNSPSRAASGSPQTRAFDFAVAGFW
jgi:hypothetical protein